VTNKHSYSLLATSFYYSYKFLVIEFVLGVLKIDFALQFQKYFNFCLCAHYYRQLLMRNCECAEEGTRNVVAECLGRLTLTNPADLLPRLRATVTSPSPLTRSTIITAVKFTISDQAQPIDVQLRAVMGEFLQALHDSDMNVRRVALVTFNSAAHNKPMLVRDLLGQVLPLLYDETQVRVSCRLALTKIWWGIT
jgi:hypothetical protein